MSLFPTIYSTLDPQALAALVTLHYGLPAATGQLLVRGVGDTYLIEATDQRFILRVYRSSHRSLSQINAEIEMLNALKKATVPVSYPIADRQGNYIQQLEAAEGVRPAVLFTYAPGTTVNKLNDAQLQNLGRAMAAFHNVSASVKLKEERWEYNLMTIFDEPLQRLQPAFASIPTEYDWWLKAADQAKSALTQLPLPDFAIGYCQYDFLPKNFHFEDDVITLFDFDFLGHGWLINDVMTFWTHLCLDVHFGRMTQAEADRSYHILLTAYRQVRPLSEAELKAIPYLSLGWWCYYMGFHMTHDQFTALTQPAQLSMRTGVIRRLTEIYW
ncbi:MAG: phosphotransferase [Chitinophagaceae bacterium]|nr:phosphotransferase [Chitinophagaceae bacterium]